MKRLVLSLALWLVLGTAAATEQVAVGVSVGVVVPRWPRARLVVIDGGYRYDRYHRYDRHRAYRFVTPARVIVVRHWPRRHRHHRW